MSLFKPDLYAVGEEIILTDEVLLLHPIEKFAIVAF